MIKIRANREALGRYASRVDIYIDGQLSQRCMEADEREGVAWVLREPLQASVYSKPGDYVCEDAIVERRTGLVEIRFTLTETDPPEDVVRQEIAARYQPASIVQVVR